MIKLVELVQSLPFGEAVLAMCLLQEEQVIVFLSAIMMVQSEWNGEIVVAPIFVWLYNVASRTRRFHPSSHRLIYPKKPQS